MSALLRVVTVFLLITLVLARGESLTLNIPAGLSAVANPFNNPAGNSVSVLFPNAPEATQLYTWDVTNLSWIVNQFQFGHWLRPQQVLNPGDGALIRVPTGGLFVNFTGTAPATISLTLNSQFQLVSWPLTNEPSWNAQDLDLIYTWDGAAQRWSSPFTYYDFGPSSEDTGWYDGMYVKVKPQPDRGRCVVYSRASGHSGSPGPSLYINNYSLGVNAPIRTTYSCVGTTLVARLFVSKNVSSPESAMIPWGPDVRVMSDGYLDPTADLIRTLSATNGSRQYVQLRVRDTRTSPASAYGDYGVYGKSAVVPLDLYAMYMAPANLNGVQPIMNGPLTLFVPQGPANVTVIEGQPSALIVTELAWSPTYLGHLSQWQRLNASQQWVDIPGATSNRLSFDHCTTNDVGAYRVILNALGCTNFICPVATLTVLAPPRFAAPFASSNDLHIQASSAPAFTYELQRSFDLSNWTTIFTQTNAPANWEFIDRTPTSNHFYRLRVQP